MITRQQLEQLQAFRPEAFVVTSCYLNLDRAQMPAAQLKIRAKDLVRAAAHELQGKAASHLQRESLQMDFEKIESFVLEEALLSGQKAVAVFCCSGAKFWQVYRLPRLVRNTLIADPAPYLRPLMAILSAYRRYCVVVVDRAMGQVFEVYMGAIVEYQAINDPLPRRGREGGFGGREERNLERRHDGAVKQHYQAVAERAFDLFKQQQFDALVLGGARDVLGEFKQHLHPYLRQRWVADLHLDGGRANAATVLQATLAAEEEVESVRRSRLATEMVRRAREGEHAVTGLAATLPAVFRGEAQSLLVQDGFGASGFLCRQCGRGGDTAVCAQCQQPAEPCADLVDAAVEQALATGCEVHQVTSSSALSEAGGIGALLRY